MLIIPPGSGIVHQVNLEYLARVVFTSENKILYPDSVVSTYILYITSIVVVLVVEQMQLYQINVCFFFIFNEMCLLFFY